MKDYRKRSRRGLAALSLALSLTACQREWPEPVFRIADPEWDTVPTRSLLTASDIETKKTEITLAAYADGRLAALGHFTQNLDAMTLELEPGNAYTLYALVNMGDMSNSIPLLESGLESITYRIPSYTEGPESIASRGIPMAGKLTWPASSAVIPVERLLAKVTAHLSCEWTGAAIRNVRVCQLNRVLRPFGEAVKEEDWTQQEFASGTGTASGSFTFYVPENRQGFIGGITTSFDKSPDRTDDVRERADGLTYLEVTAEGTGTYAGTITYRSYLGQDAVSDFDIRRNAHYLWTVRYLPDGLQYNDWKHANQLTDTRFLYWKEHPGERVIHTTLQVGKEGTRAGDFWRPGDFVLGDATGTQRLQGEYISADRLLDQIGYSIDTERFRYFTHFSDAVWFKVGEQALPVGDYRTDFYYLDRPDLSITAWLHVRSESDLHIDDGWDDGSEQELH